MTTLSGVTSPRIRIAIPGLFVQGIRVNLLEGKSRHIPRERVAHHKVSVDTQLFPEFSNLVLEHLPQRLDQFQLSGAVSEMRRRGQSPDPEKWDPEDSRPGRPEYTGTLRN